MRISKAISKPAGYALALIVIAVTIVILIPRLLPRAVLNLQLLGCMEAIHKGVSCPANFDPSDPPAQYHHARNALLGGQPDRAILAFQNLEPTFHNSLLIAYYLGSAYRMQGLEQKALATWSDAQLGDYFIRRGAFAASVSDLEIGIKLGQQAPETYYLLGDVLWDLRRTEEAAQAYLKGLAVDHTNGLQAWLAQGRLAEADKDWERAIAAYQNAVNAEPAAYTSYLRIGNIYRFDLHDAPRALVWYQKCVTNAPEHMWGYLLAAEIERQNSHYADALALAAAARKTDFLSAAPYLNMGITWMTQGVHEQAKRAFETAAGLEPNNYWPPFYLGLLAYRNENWEQARVHLQRSTELNPRYAGSFLLLGQSLEQSGRKADAIAAYRHVLTLIPNSPEAQAALARLQ